MKKTLYLYSAEMVTNNLLYTQFTHIKIFFLSFSIKPQVFIVNCFEALEIVIFMILSLKHKPWSCGEAERRSYMFLVTTNRFLFCYMTIQQSRVVSQHVHMSDPQMMMLLHQAHQCFVKMHWVLTTRNHSAFQFDQVKENLVHVLYHTNANKSFTPTFLR